MGIRERREREKNELRTRILDAARELILEAGVEAVSMRKIAERIEYSPTAIYQHFADKEALIRAMCDRDFEAFAEELREHAREADPIRRIRAAGEVYLRFAQEYPDHFRVMFMTPHMHPDELNAEDHRKRGDPDVDGYAFLHVAVDEAMRANRFRPDLGNPDLIVQTLWAAVHGVATLHITHQRDPWVPWAPLIERHYTMLDAVLRGMLRNPEEVGAIASTNTGTAGVQA